MSAAQTRALPSSAFLTKNNVKTSLKRNTRAVAVQARRRLRTNAGLASAIELAKADKIRVLNPGTVAACVAEGYQVLDIRPPWEFENGHVDPSLHVPYFVEDEGTDLTTLLKKQVVMGYGGLWQGNRLTKENEDFSKQITAAAPADSKLIVVCSEGLRSLVASEVLYEMGYTNLAWLDGGLQQCTKEHFPNQAGVVQVKFSHIGGFSKVFLKIASLLNKTDNPYLDNN